MFVRLTRFRLFPETYTFFRQVEERYGIEIERIQPDTTEVEKNGRRTRRIPLF